MASIPVFRFLCFLSFLASVTANRMVKKGSKKSERGPQCGTGSGGVNLDGKFSYYITHGSAVEPLTSILGNGGVVPIASSGYFTFNQDGPCTCQIAGVRNFGSNNFGEIVHFSVECTYSFDDFGVGFMSARFADIGLNNFTLSVVSQEEFSFMFQDQIVAVGVGKKTYLEP